MVEILVVKMNEIKFTVFLPPNLNLNKFIRTHWAERDRLCQDLYDEIHWNIRAHFRERTPDWGKIKVSYTICTQRMMDVDNSMIIVKTINDGIKKTGLIKDDSPKYLEWEKPGFITTGRSEERKVKIKVERVK